MSKYHFYCSCVECKLELTVQNLAGHIRGAHTIKGQCLECKKDLFVGKKFCSSSCSATHNNQLRPKKVRTIKEKIDKTLERFYLGEVKERPTIRKILSKLRGYECECCGLSDWQGREITLQVDHIDGNAGNNMPDNLRLICPNCHSQTDSFGGGNKGSGRAFRGLPLH